MQPEEQKRILIIAGPNGAGKTTFAREFLPDDQFQNFVNADLIAEGLSPFNSELAAVRAGRVMLEEIEGFVNRGESFAFETTLSGRPYVRRVRGWRQSGYHVELLFLQLQDVETATERVAKRVAQGGHDIPEDVIRRRFDAGLRNLDELYKPAVDRWSIYDNSGPSPVHAETAENL